MESCDRVAVMPSFPGIGPILLIAACSLVLFAVASLGCMHFKHDLVVGINETRTECAGSWPSYTSTSCNGRTGNQVKEQHRIYLFHFP